MCQAQTKRRFVNSVEPDVTARYGLYHLELHCFQPVYVLVCRDFKGLGKIVADGILFIIIIFSEKICILSEENIAADDNLYFIIYFFRENKYFLWRITKSILTLSGTHLLSTLSLILYKIIWFRPSEKKLSDTVGQLRLRSACLFLQSG